jgi:transcriptional regulator with XRE-family HTH domain/tetratricopeptide (TPR) repeat protein
MTVNRLLYTARRQKHWSQKQAAKACDVDLQTYFRWEHGGQQPHGYNLDRLCEVFGRSMEELGYAQLIEVQAEGETAASPGDQSESLVRLTPEQVDALLPLIGDSTVDSAKRDTLRAILAAAGVAVAAPLALVVDPEPWERLNLAVTKPSVLDQKTLHHFRDLLRISWELSNSNELGVVERTLPQFLPRLLQVAHYQPEAAMLAAQGLRLQGILAAHKLQLGEKVTQSKQAVAHARFSTDNDALVSSLTELAVAYKYANQSHLALQTYQEALASVHQASPLLQSRVYAASASAFAKAGRKREARFYIDLAHETFPPHPEQDPSVAFADYGVWLLIFYTGLTHMDLGEHQQAWDAFDQIRSVSVSVPERNRLEIINQQGKTAILLNNLDKYALSLGDGIASSVALQSKKRFDEALHIFRQDMPQSWLASQPIKEIVERYHLEVEGKSK